MTRKRIKERRQRNIEITKQDRANRCARCLKALGPLYRWRRQSDGKEFCSYDCWVDDKSEAQHGPKSMEG